uniref:Transmembrane protein n=1 Tax=Palpitomonas bilix TaxID=652834 RepID=A0A7S3GF05_9EUKA|mmetsp:Transcript_46679/g.120365  ORF Transcript_46679/g.120365 Transcript_46679/m.120365 type:complete len:434 (+) Transcript_46679:339-1640(+)|eukprot:CAMPEP_0113890060 /NCGR_PEP_ID=MMETSP0780_2-20120614/13897_1 /TAXON_ID=652834 /ORGANISM="Palpitomonas bilix" /LENGTH=433 /DNA_ID=CAMNT_0000879337 /DNA_START=282 /DNA_END=1583 /DNA_ORIENTATION=- /assembly_acc=CAM_ASM_000599
MLETVLEFFFTRAVLPTAEAVLVSASYVWRKKSLRWSLFILFLLSVFFFLSLAFTVSVRWMLTREVVLTQQLPFDVGNGECLPSGVLSFLPVQDDVVSPIPASTADRGSAGQQRCSSLLPASLHVPVIRRGGVNAIPPRSSFSVSLSFSFPDREENKRIGMFMVYMEARTREGKVVKRAARNVLLPYEGYLLQIVKAFAYLPARFLGLMVEEKRVEWTLADRIFQTEGDDEISALSFSVSNPAFLFSSASVSISIFLSGISWYIVSFPFLSGLLLFSVSFSFLFLSSLLVFTLARVEAETRRTIFLSLFYIAFSPFIITYHLAVLCWACCRGEEEEEGREAGRSCGECLSSAFSSCFCCCGGEVEEESEERFSRIRHVTNSPTSVPLGRQVEERRQPAAQVGAEDIAAADDSDDEFLHEMHAIDDEVRRRRGW